MSRTEADSSDPLTTASPHQAGLPNTSHLPDERALGPRPAPPRGRELPCVNRPPRAVLRRPPRGRTALGPPRAGAPTPRPPVAPAQAGGTLEGTDHTQDPPQHPAKQLAGRKDWVLSTAPAGTPGPPGSASAPALLGGRGRTAGSPGCRATRDPCRKATIPTLLFREERNTATEASGRFGGLERPVTH